MIGAQPRIAIASPGVGLVQRGYERLFTDLFHLMRDEFSITLLKGGGPRLPDERMVPFLHRNSAVLRSLPVHKLFGRTPYHSECLMFALGMLPHLRGGRFDVVHTIDPPLTRLLFRLRARLGLRFTLLYTDGAGMAPSDYPPADHTQQIAQFAMDQALAYGYSAETMTMLPCGFHPERFQTGRDRAALRREYGIAPGTFVILSVAAINRGQKRTDYLVDEVAQLQGDWLLLLDGSLDHGDPELADYARARLGDGVRISQVPSAKVGELYKLADVMAHAATFESFGLAIVEAAASGLPVITHDGPHFRWLLPNPACWIDARQPGAMAGKLRAAMANPSLLDRMRESAGPMRQRFDWRNLKPGYAALYRHAAALPRHGAPEAACRQAA